MINLKSEKNVKNINKKNTKNIYTNTAYAKNNIRAKLFKAYVQLITVGLCFLPKSAFAAPSSMEGVATGIINAILEIAKYAGTAMIVGGAVMTIVAFKNDNAESQTNGIRFLLIGAALAFLKTLLTTAGLI